MKLYKYSLILILGFSTLVSCSDKMDLLNPNQQTSSTFGFNADDLEESVIAAYNHIRMDDWHSAAVDADVGCLGSSGHFAPYGLFLLISALVGDRRRSGPHGTVRQRERGEEKQSEPLGSMEDSVHVEHI